MKTVGGANTPLDSVRSTYRYAQYLLQTLGAATILYTIRIWGGLVGCAHAALNWSTTGRQLVC